MKFRGGPRQRRRALMQCARRPTRRKRRRAARAPCWAIRAWLRPSAGVVTARMADPGTMAAPGVPLLQVDQAGALQLQATVDESAIGAIHKGMKVQVAIDGAGIHEYDGDRCGDCSRRRSIEPQLSGQDRSCLPQASCAPACMERPSSPTAPARRFSFRAPRSSLRGSLACAYVLDGQGIAQLRYLTLGAATGQSRRSSVGHLRRRKAC